MGHIKMLGGPYVARGPDVAQAWSRPFNKQVKPAYKKIVLFFIKNIEITIKITSVKRALKG